MTGLKIAVIGDRESVMGFRALGLDVFPAEKDEAKELFRRLTKEQDTPYAIIYITEQLASRINEEISRYKDQLTPAVILIPGKEGSLGIGMSKVSESVERAIGANIR